MNAGAKCRRPALCITSTHACCSGPSTASVAAARAACRAGLPASGLHPVTFDFPFTVPFRGLLVCEEDAVECGHCEVPIGGDVASLKLLEPDKRQFRVPKGDTCHYGGSAVWPEITARDLKKKSKSYIE